MLATHSREAEIERRLKNLNCSGRSFVLIARLLGTSISESRLSEYVRGIQSLGKDTEDKMIDTLDRMVELQNAVFSAVDVNGNRIGFVQVAWTETEKVVDALTARQLAAIARDEGLDEDKRFMNLADSATRRTV